MFEKVDACAWVNVRLLKGPVVQADSLEFDVHAFDCSCSVLMKWMARQTAYLLNILQHNTFDLRNLGFNFRKLLYLLSMLNNIPHMFFYNWSANQL